MKIVGISTVSRSEHHVAQTRELESTKIVVPQVIARGELHNIYKCLNVCLTLIVRFTGLNVVEVAHDMQLAVRRYLMQDLKLVNSFDTWHGMLQQCSV